MILDLTLRSGPGECIWSDNAFLPMNTRECMKLMGEAGICRGAETGAGVPRFSCGRDSGGWSPV